MGYEERPSGLRELHERGIATNRSKIGMVFQHYNLFSNMTALENVMSAPIHVKKEPKTFVRERALALLRRVGLQDKTAAYPPQLPGGQQQRVAIVERHRHFGTHKHPGLRARSCRCSASVSPPPQREAEIMVHTSVTGSCPSYRQQCIRPESKQTESPSCSVFGS